MTPIIWFYLTMGFLVALCVGVSIGYLVVWLLYKAGVWVDYEIKMNLEQANMMQDLISALMRDKTELPFEMDNWITSYSDEYVNFITQDKLKHALECGYAACAAGLGLLTIPSWQTFNAMSDDGEVDATVLCDCLGLTSDEGVRLFAATYYSSSSDTTPAMVANRVALVIHDNGFGDVLVGDGRVK